MPEPFVSLVLFVVSLNFFIERHNLSLPALKLARAGKLLTTVTR